MPRPHTEAHSFRPARRPVDRHGADRVVRHDPHRGRRGPLLCAPRLEVLHGRQSRPGPGHRLRAPDVDAARRRGALAAPDPWLRRGRQMRRLPLLGLLALPAIFASANAWAATAPYPPPRTPSPTPHPPCPPPPPP